jgi:uncharacterized repeat protein (TIGR03806 family)
MAAFASGIRCFRMVPRILLVCWCVVHFTHLALAAAPYGLTSRATVGPFLNGQMPSVRPGTGNAQFYTDEAFPNLTFEDPTFLLAEPGTNRLYVLTRQGAIYHFVNNPSTSTKTMFLDLRTQTQGFEDCGMLGMAFHPQWRQAGSPNRGYVYVWYQFTTNRVFPPPGLDRPDAYQNTWMRLSRFTVPDNSTVASPNSELVMINQFDRHLWHNGGGMFFGPDGFLYVTVGDEGGLDDEFHQSQKLNGGIFSGVLRIDVDSDPSRSHPIRRQPQSPAGSPPSYTQQYYIPNDNPWLDPAGTILEEFWAVGLRSPHRMTRDPVSGLVLIGDIGQGQREEINILERGANYQWSYREGTYPWGPVPSPLIGVERPPFHEYERGNGDTCVIGGYIYRGSQLPELNGKYIFGDNTSGRIFALTFNGANNPPSVVYLCNMPPGNDYTGLSSFGVDNNNELYMCHMGPNNKIWKLARVGGGAPPAPALLSQTGAFANTATLAPSPHLVPYTVNAALWSDGAHKLRWMSVPTDGAPYGPNEQIQFAPTGEWTFPSGTVFVKHFEIATNESNPNLRRRLETRLLVRDTNGGVYGVTYKWRANQLDADVLQDSLNEDIVIQSSTGIRTQTWFYPSPQDCLTCHTPAANHVLGVKTRHLNGSFTYPSTGVTDNQLRTLNNVSYFSPALNEASIPGYARTAAINDNNASLELRVRSYIDANCAGCHRPGGVQGYWDARFDTALNQQNILNGPVNNNFGIADARVVVPGEPDRSLLYVRAYTNSAIKMPPLARNVVDTEATTAMRDWINSFTASGLPAPWQHQDIGAVGLAGDASFINGSGIFSVIGSGTDIWGAADEGHFVFQPIVGNCEIIARVTAVGNTSPWAKAGVMIRETLSPGAKNVMNAMTAQNGAEVQWRSVANDESSYVQGPALQTPAWVRLTRTGDVIRAYHSANGASWTDYGGATIAMSSNILIGMAVTAVDNSALNRSSFDSVTVRATNATDLDSDGDGMPDSWERMFDLNPNNPDPLHDPDGDGFPNYHEYIAGTNPRDPASLLRIVNIAHTNNNVILRFGSVPGKMYSVERAVTLPRVNWEAITNIPSGNNTTVAVTNSTGVSTQSYFRLRVVP